jgi:acyl-[acyl-carrier-protein]-phospholipid O-acyltransferase / long-chain-fatty-acid--[acyl-carrier-protein] ligase
MDACPLTLPPVSNQTSNLNSSTTPRGLGGHLTACIVGAGIDNLFRQVALFLFSAVAYTQFPNNVDMAKQQSAAYGAWALILFSLPFVLLAPLAGSLGDRYPKHLIIRAARIADVPIAALGIWGFAISSPTLMFSALALLAIASSFFAPTKLAVIPELVPPERLAKANAIIAAATVIAILVGTCLAISTDANQVKSVLKLLGINFTPSATVWSLAIVSTILCTSGIIGAYRIPALKAQAPHTPIAMPWMVITQIRALNHNPGTWSAALALAGFWALGGAAFAGINTIADFTYKLSSAETIGLYLAIVLGMAVGSVIAPRLNTRAFPAGLPLIGALIAGSAFTLAGTTAAIHDQTLLMADRHAFIMVFWLFVTGIGCGLWEVPVTILLQERSLPSQRNLVMAAVTVLGSFGTFISAGICLGLTAAGLTTAMTFIVCGVFTLVSASALTWHYRKQCAGWLMALIVKIAYHVRVTGAENLPLSGGCLVVCNHLSYSDGIILASHLPRPGRFLVYRQYTQMPVVGLFLRAAGVIPVAAEDSRRALLASIDAAIEAAKTGEVVVIFPEGKLTHSGQMDTFRSGLERIASRANVPVVPAHLDGLWGTISSRSLTWAFPRLQRAVSLNIGAPLPSTTSAAEARAQVMALSYQSAQAQSDRNHRTLGGEVLSRMRRHPFRAAIRDVNGVLSYWKLVAVARILAGRLGLADDERCVGLLLPPGRGGAMANLALAFMGRTAVNLNHTVGPVQLKRMCEMAGIRTIISATPYLRRIGDPGLSQRLVQLDVVMEKTSAFAVIMAACAAYSLPSRLLNRAKANDVAAIIFSSGSTGDPKGVELTHRQVLANISAVAQGLEVSGECDVSLSPLPLFHSFGLVPGFWLGMVLGMPSAAHPDPTDAKALGALAKVSGATFLLSTPTFVRGYLRRIEPEQFKTLRFAVVGAERCPPDLKLQFRERYGAELLEGYGCTELGPTVTLNLLPIKRDGVTEIRSRDGAVGRPLPGLNVFTIDPETQTILPAGSEGLLVVQSTSRMRGYLDRPDLTEKAFIHHGYNTGDVGRVDEDGFVHITGRMARFAKIGGEMVPLDHVEAAVFQAVLTIVGPDATIEIAVASIADEARGERLIILHTGFTGDWEKLLADLAELPALWRPRSRDVRLVEAIPKLGTGKRDLAGLKKLAAGTSNP